MHPFKDEIIVIDYVQFAAEGNWEDVQVVRFDESADLNDLSD
ncbi:MAG: hypothetical protein O2963_01560 [Proteobacteria bacterium]|jgi:hypothetical protein|nr:hypothetical protein [Pseudomonadota bacterium]